MQGEGLGIAVDRAAAAIIAAGCGAVVKARAGDGGRGAGDAALAVQRAAVVGGSAVFEAAVDHFDGLRLGVHRAAVVVGGIGTCGGAAVKRGVFDGGFFSVAGRLVVSIHVSVIDCAAVRSGTAILERAVFHTQLCGSGFNRAAVGPGVPICQTILKSAVFDGR